jgi:MerR family copper efflux transcriptional regulator
VRNNRGQPGIFSSGASRHTLRYYESLGLISALRRDNNYREYSPNPQRPEFYPAAQGMGFSLGEIGEILKARCDQQLACAQGATLVSRTLAEDEQKIANLHQQGDFLLREKRRLEASTAEQIAIQVLMTAR